MLLHQARRNRNQTLPLANRQLQGSQAPAAWPAAGSPAVTSAASAVLAHGCSDGVLRKSSRKTTPQPRPSAVKMPMAQRQGRFNQPISTVPRRKKEAAPPMRPKKVAIQPWAIVRILIGNQFFDTLLRAG